MKVKTFISPSVHVYYYELITKLLDSTTDEQKKNNLIKELATQKEELEHVFTQYKEKFEELHRLIVVYQAQQTQIRKKIRQIQLTKKETGE